MSDFPKPRAMTRKEVKAMRKAGMDPAMKSDANNREIAKLGAEMTDWILDNIYKDHDFESTGYDKLVKLAEDTYLISMGRKVQEDEAKN